MAYNEGLANRIRKAFSSVSGVKEQEKMGGISFMMNGKMLVRAHSDGTMMLRCKPEMTELLLQKKGVTRFEMKGKPMMKGWLLIHQEGMEKQKDFDDWIKVAREFNNN